jgi:TrmH family RNA methyltransferase
MITSVNNDRVKLVRALQSRRRERARENAFVIEGYRLAQEAIRAGASIREVYYVEAFADNADGAALIASFSKLGAVATEVSPQVMAAMSDTETPQGILAVLPVVVREAPEHLSSLLVIDGLNTPGNLGAVLRTAAAAGVEAVALAPGTVDPTNPKVVRGAMGAHFRLPIVQWNWETIIQAAEGMHVLLADVDGEAAYDDVDWRQTIALILGGEAHGASEEAARLAHARVTIPMQRGIESLNAAVAAGVLLFEMARQRKQEGDR